MFMNPRDKLWEGAASGDVEKVRKAIRKVSPNIQDSTGATPLILAASHGHVGVVSILATTGVSGFRADVNLARDNGMTALYVASHLGHTEVVHTLLQYRADPALARNDGTTPLLIATMNGHADAVLLLLRYRANPNVPDKDGITPVFAASGKGFASIVHALIANGAHVNVPCLDGMTALFVAAKYGHVDVVRYLAHAAHVDAATADGVTPLLVAAANGQVEIVQMLLQARANSNTADADGLTPLIAACLGGHRRVVQALLRAKADVNVVTNNGYTALLLAAESGDADIVRMLAPLANVNATRRHDGAAALHIAIRNKHQEIVEALVAVANADLATSDGTTPLALACDVGHLRILALVLRSADASLVTQSGLTPLMVAVATGSYDVAALLVHHTDVNIPCMNGNTPLFVAAQRGDLAMVQLLLNCRPNVDYPSSDTGATPLLAAAQGGYSDIVRVLLAGGAQVNLPMHDGATALILACQSGHEDVVTCLLARGDPNLATNTGATALLMAVQNRHVAIVRRLVGRADVNRVDHTGTSALHLAALHGFKDIVDLVAPTADANVMAMSGATALYFAAEKGHVDIARVLLPTTDVDLALHTGTTPLYIASQHGHADVVKLLLPTADVNAAREVETPTDGATPLLVATLLGHSLVVRHLLLHPHINVNHPLHTSRDTALHVACAAGHTGIVRQLLLHKSIDMSVVNAAGQTPVQVAMAHRHDDAVAALNERLADRSFHGNAPSFAGSSMSWLDSSRSGMGSMRSLKSSRSIVLDDEAVLQELDLVRLPDTHVKPIKQVGAGMFTAVWLGTYRDTRVAIKSLRPESATIDLLQLFVDEIQLLHRIQSAFVVSLIGASWKHPMDLKSVMEVMDGGDLHAVVATVSPQSLPWPTKLDILQRLVEGLAYLHSDGVVHRDLKSTSVLLTSSYVAKLGGFGLSGNEIDDVGAMSLPTSRYSAPEVMASGAHTAKSDVFSFGAIVAEVTTHQPPYGTLDAAMSNAAIQSQVATGSLHLRFPKHNCPDWLYDLAIQCVAVNPDARPNVYALSAAFRKHFQPPPSHTQPPTQDVCQPANVTTSTATSNLSPRTNDSSQEPDASNDAAIEHEEGEFSGIARLEETRLSLVARLGSGAFGDVWRATYKNDPVAVKKLHPHMLTTAQVQGFLAEIKLMTQFDSPHIVTVLGACWTTLSDVRCVMELMDGGDLGNRLATSTPDTFSWTAKVAILVNVMEALCEVHDINVIHRDLKSRNVLLDSTKPAKLTDFGISKEKAEHTMTNGMGTCRWMAPEVIEGSQYTVSADIYSFGMILAEMDSHEIPFRSHKNKSGGPMLDTQIMLGVVRGDLKPTFSDDCPPWIKAMALECVATDPNDRPHAYKLAHDLRTRHRRMSRSSSNVP